MTEKEIQNHTELFTDRDTVLTVKDFMKKKRLRPKHFIAIGASASYPLKCWPLKNFNLLISYLIANKWAVVLVGGPNEKESLFADYFVLSSLLCYIYISR